MIIIKKSSFVKSIVDIADRPFPQLPEFAFVGRSNVGKSSLINSLLNRKKLAKVSKTPGKTRTINYFLINDNLYFVDLPGYGFAQVSKEEQNRWKKMIEKYLLNSEELLNIWILLDLNVAVQPRDYQLIEWLNTVKLPFQIIATKSDKLGYGAVVKRVKKIRQELNLRDEIKIIPYSAKKHTGRELLLKRMSEML